MGSYNGTGTETNAFPYIKVINKWLLISVQLTFVSLAVAYVSNITFPLQPDPIDDTVTQTRYQTLLFIWFNLNAIFGTVFVLVSESLNPYCRPICIRLRPTICGTKGNNDQQIPFSAITVILFVYLYLFELQLARQ